MEKQDIRFVIGIDLGDKYSEMYVIDRDGGAIEERRVETKLDPLTRALAGYERARVAIEVGTHSPWVSRLIGDLGHQVVIANPRMLGLIHGTRKKNDKLDAKKLAMVADYDPELLAPIRHRSVEAQAEVAVLRSRDVMVAARTKLVNHVRGATKSIGGRLKKCSTGAFGKTAPEQVPEILRPALLPVIEEIDVLSAKILEFDRMIEELNKKHPETERLRQVSGVGAVTALAFVLMVGNPLRFKKSRDVGAYFGLVCRQSQSGGNDPELRITKTGDKLMRRLLVQSAHYILGPFGKDCDLRRWGLALSKRGRKNAKKRATVAASRKLAVLLLRLWVTGKPYEPLRNAKRKERSAAPPPKGPVLTCRPPGTEAISA